ncbi:hypothetical protein [Bacillus altitudinis]|uniref:hypothetical protein n=1 Tax=Bacillus altitudinis TaxID=293387 RepID=UPI00045C4EFA|nr:hypothetical protein [Bacillus altitudinis]MBW3701109.1 hypothetical protein [Bacillus aerophilus]KDE29898.1 hypothetical protein BA79_15922 [Bacillus altitudinis 41KF2b]MDI6649031.1 hypothetical protein [Bacillus altitudinis]MDI6663586.1 hypothetical protein [Bacillus altitudinis]MEC1043720.1 hypothetical protein [Bacillus altitudinis]
MSEVTLFHSLSPKLMPNVFDCFISQKIRDCWYFMDFSEKEFNRRESEFLNNLPGEELLNCKEEGLLQSRDPFGRKFEELRRYSFLIMIHSLLEEYAVELCRVEKKRWEKHSKASRKSTLVKVKIFIMKELERNFPNQTREWKIITDVNLIRNELVHNGGDIGRSHKCKEVSKIIEKMKDISIGNHNTIVLDKDFCFNYLRTVESFLSNLYKNYSSPPDN